MLSISRAGKKKKKKKKERCTKKKEGKICQLEDEYGNLLLWIMFLLGYCRYLTLFFDKFNVVT
jgi:hypothetical protein